MLFPESDTNLFHIHFRVFRARNTVAPDINEVMKYNSHAPQEEHDIWIFGNQLGRPFRVVSD